MRIGFVAGRVGLSVDAIRFYERNGSLPRASRTNGGFRQFGEHDVDTLSFIRRTLGWGFKLSEIRSLLTLRGNRIQPCAPVRRRLQAKLNDVRGKLANLRNLSMDFCWPSTVATESCESRMRTVRFCRTCG